MHAQTCNRANAIRGVFLAALMVVVGYAANAQTGKSLVINHFVSDPAVVDGYLVVADVEGTGGSINLTVYDQNGTMEGRGTETIPANGKVNVNPAKYVSGKKMIGTIRITSTHNICGQYWQFYKDSKLGWKNIVVPAAVAPGSTKLICQHFVSDPNVESYIVVADGDGHSKTAYVEFYSDRGELAGQTTVSIPANGKVSIQPYDLVSKKKMTGVAYIQTDGGTVTGEYWQVSPKEKYQIAHAMQSAAPESEELVDEPIMRIMVNFDFNSDKIQKRSTADLMEVAKAMNSSKMKGAKFEIGGYTDDSGNRDYNIKLSERRANSVKNFLTKQGKVNKSRLVAKGYGPDNPIVPNDSEANRARNRRVEFKRL
jgi:outer membrane protein OmpA-like peptidoglycan-associated protein